MPLYLTDKDVESLVNIEDAIAALTDAFLHWHRDGTENLPRQRLPLPTRTLNLMAASAPTLGVCGHKAYFGGCHYVSLYSLQESRLLALIQAGRLGAIRTGAASGLATRCLARDDAKTVGLIGTGRQARTQLMAVASVRPIEMVRVFGRDPERRTTFVREMNELLSCDIIGMDNGENCVRDADIVIAATNASDPVVFGSWLTSGCHLNAVGANSYARRELDNAAVMHASLIATDDRGQAQVEARELIDLTSDGKLAWADVAELGELVQEQKPGRQNSEDITLFKSLGVALEDVAFGKAVYDRAVEAGIGQSFG